MPLSFTVTRRKLVTSGSSRDATTGHREVSYVDSTIECRILDQGQSIFNLPGGAYIRIDALGVTVDPVAEWDQIKTDEGRYYKVMAVKENMGPGDNFVDRHLALSLIPYYKES